jgi:hypothetical protein
VQPRQYAMVLAMNGTSTPAPNAAEDAAAKKARLDEDFARLAAQLSHVELTTRLLDTPLYVNAAARKAKYSEAAKHLQRGFLPGMKLHLKMYLGGAYRIFASSGDSPDGPTVERFMRLADMVVLHFWKYRNTARLPSDAESAKHFNFDAGQANADLTNEVAVLVILQQMEALLLQTADSLVAQVHKPRSKSKVVLAGLLDVEKRLTVLESTIAQLVKEVKELCKS